jgi:glucose/mannose-6-phosphate isomerase
MRDGRGAAPSLHSEIDTATALLERLVEEWGPDSSDDALPKRLARALRGTLPVIHGSGPTVAIARRWHTQLNENAKAPAFWSELPEANHNEIGTWDRGRRLAPLSAVFLEDPDQHPRIGRRIDLTCEEVERSGAPAIRVNARGESRLERVLSHVLLGDLVSVYLAALEGVDPTPVEAIERLKAALD